MIRKAIYTSMDEELLIEEGKEWNFHEEDTTEHLHTLHPYPAKFIPQIPRKAISSWSKEGELIYDPFMGCGTTLVEAGLLNRPSIGTDNNDVAVLISKAKTSKYADEDISRLLCFGDNLGQALDATPPQRALIPDNKNFLYWFSDDVLGRLSSLKALILMNEEPVRTMLLAIFSSIIVRVSFQDSDTRYAKVEKKVSVSDVEKHFKNKLYDVVKSLKKLAIYERENSQCFQSDARNISFIDSDSVSLIVTSPPYLNAYDYHKYHRQRIHWIDGSVENARDLEIGCHDKFTRPKAKPDQYFVDMEACFKEWSRVLRSGGHCLIVVGDAIVTKSPVAVGDRFVDLMEANNFRTEKRWIRELHSTKRAFNVRNSRMSHEHILLFKKV